MQLDNFRRDQLTVIPLAVFPDGRKAIIGFGVIETQLAPIDILFWYGLMHGCAPAPGKGLPRKCCEV